MKEGYPTQLDETDQWLYDNFGILAGACSSTENLRHTTARRIAEALWPKNDVPLPEDTVLFNKGVAEGRRLERADLGWISVKDRLPDTTEYVFTCIEQNGIPQCVGFHYYKDGKWWEGFEEDTVGAVDYWMPIPKLPKK